ncbi:hypothetical protein ACIGD1_09490 [Streptomyces sp. NPDC085612]|uniref:hypothetical protein n=1 Tax=Streptomyces sp. NPDC085612 TaxID=3365732 RepID=UPI0037D60CB4
MVEPNASPVTGAPGAPTAAVLVPVGALLAADSPRAVRVDEGHAQELAASGRTLPPLLVHRTTMRVVDGSQTVAALRRREAPARAPQGRVGRDGRVRPADPARRREVAARLLAGRPTASLRQIAREAGTAPSTVRDVRRRIGEGADPVPAAQRRSGNGPAPAPVPARGRGQPLPALVTGLCKDPLLRLSEAGRLLLRMLDLQVSALRQRERIVAAVPPYRAETAAAAAAQCARDWQDLSEELQRRASAQTPA